MKTVLLRIAELTASAILSYIPIAAMLWDIFWLQGAIEAGHPVSLLWLILIFITWLIIGLTKMNKED